MNQVFNRAQWSPWVLSKLLLGLLIKTCLPPGVALVLVIDDTLERRRGPKIKYKGWFRDPIRSTVNHVSTSLGIRWLCVALSVTVPWSRRPWSLPFILSPTLSPETSRKLGKKHRTLLAWAEYLVVKIRRWQPDRPIVLVGDGAFAAMPLLQRCQRKHIRVTLIARMRFDAVLHRPPGPQPNRKPGPKPKKGARLPNPQAYLDDPTTNWTEQEVLWYGGQPQMVEIATRQCLWYRRGLDPAPIRWVLVRCPTDETFEPLPLLCADPEMAAPQIVECFVRRWDIEVTFEEIRAQLGFETQRHWSDKAIERTAPVLFGLFSLVTLIAMKLHPEQLPVQSTAWYHKQEATFSDALAAVRRHLWGLDEYCNSADQPEMLLIPASIWARLVQVALYAT
jgi:hypothetical protein